MSNTLPTATLYYDPNSCIHWLEFLHQPDDATRADLYSAGWRWRRYREQWSTSERFPKFPKGVTISLGGAVDYSAERAERLETRADLYSAEAERRYEASNRIADGIPLAQPILVGHHSEKRHRRDLDRIAGHMNASIEERAKAQRLEERAEGSARHQAHMAQARLIYSRLESFKADLAHLREQTNRYDPEQYPILVASFEQRITIEEYRLADAGGYTPPTPQSTGAQPGDIIRVRSYPWPYMVKSVNKKTLSVVYKDGERRHSGTIDPKDVKEIAARCAESMKPCRCEWGSVWKNDQNERGLLIGGHRETCSRCEGTGYVSTK